MKNSHNRPEPHPLELILLILAIIFTILVLYFMGPDHPTNLP